MDEIKYKALNNSIEDLRLRINLEKSKIKTDIEQKIKASSFIYSHVREISLFIALVTILISVYPLLSVKEVTKDKIAQQSVHLDIYSLESGNSKKFDDTLVKKILILREENAKLLDQIVLKNDKINSQKENLSILNENIENSEFSVSQIKMSLNKMAKENVSLKNDLKKLTLLGSPKVDTHLKIENNQNVKDLNQNLAVLITKTKIQQKKINSALMIIGELKKERDDLISRVSKQSSELIQLSKLYSQN